MPGTIDGIPPCMDGCIDAMDGALRSLARGEGRPGSDADLFIVLRDGVMQGSLPGVVLRGPRRGPACKFAWLKERRRLVVAVREAPLPVELQAARMPVREAAE